MKIEPENAAEPKAPFITSTLVILLTFSVFYFADVLILQSEKYFWYDELCTVLFCRLSVHTLWSARNTGLDFTPPLFHIVTKASQAIFGRGQLGTRAPEIIAFWVLCVCLFRFANRRLGPFAGIIAMLFPVFTETLYYAYEARPYGLVLGCGGIALVSWQMLLEDDRRIRWLAAFSGSLLLAFLLHSFALLLAVPFGVTEIYRMFRGRSISWPFWSALVIPAVLAILSYIPGIVVYRSIISGTNYNLFFPHGWGEISHFYIALLSPCILLVIAPFALMAIALLRSAPEPEPADGEATFRVEEILVAICFTLLPALGVFLAKAAHTTFFARYFCSALIGISLLVTMALGVRRVSRIGQPAFVGLLAVTAMWQLSSLLWDRYRHVPSSPPEPSSRVTMNVTLAGPLSDYKPLLALTDTSAPIALKDPLDFLYLVYYSPELRPRLYFVATEENDSFHKVFNNFLPLSPIRYNSSVSMKELFRLTPHVYIYGRDVTHWLAPVVASGVLIRSVHEAHERILADVILPGG